MPYGCGPVSIASIDRVETIATTTVMDTLVQSNCWWIEFPLSAKPPPAVELGFDLTNFSDKLIYAQYLKLWIHALAALLRCVEPDENGSVDTQIVKTEDVARRMMKKKIEVSMNFREFFSLLVVLVFGGLFTGCRSLQDIARQLIKHSENETDGNFTEDPEDKVMNEL